MVTSLNTRHYFRMLPIYKFLNSCKYFFEGTDFVIICNMNTYYKSGLGTYIVSSSMANYLMDTSDDFEYIYNDINNYYKDVESANFWNLEIEIPNPKNTDWQLIIDNVKDTVVGLISKTDSTRIIGTRYTLIGTTLYNSMNYEWY